MTRYAKRKLKYSHNENFNLLPYVECDRFVTLTGAPLVMGGAYPYMDLNAKYEKCYYDVLLRLIQIRISPKRGKCTYRHYLKIVGNNKLGPDMQKES
jgi:hypothetical protein